MTASTPPPPALPANALSLLHQLNEHRIEYILVGELAAGLHGCDHEDDSVVVVPARFERNLDRLAAALRIVGARSRVGTAGASQLSANGLKGLGHWRLSTLHGTLEIDFEPPATAGHLDLFENARRIAVSPETGVEVASVADLVRIAQMRRDVRDEALLPALEALMRASAPVLTPQ
jgi:hypothetical protein